MLCLGCRTDPILHFDSHRVLTDGLKSCIHLLLADDAQAPLNEVIVEDTFVELMEDIGCDTREDVGEGKVFPKRFVHFAQTFHIKPS